MSTVLHIIGGGLAGSEAAWQAANQGRKVKLYEKRSSKENRTTPAHKTDTLAELVCSNSFRSDDADNNAVGLLHEELRIGNSLIMQCADANSIPAGGALAVDRDTFAEAVQTAIEQHANIEIVREEITELPDQNWGDVIIATGPLTSESLAQSILEKTGKDQLAFFDAIAPVIYTDSINFETAWYQSRYDKQGPSGTGKDYINCPMTKEQYNNFIERLIETDTIEFKDWEKDTPYFEGCLPIEVMASRGPETLRYGPLKPVGLTNPNSEEPPYAVVQLRQDNKEATLYNMVGFQTKLSYGGQTELFRTIPGLENATFARLGGIHRNTFINSPELLDNRLQLKTMPNIKFAGQVTGVEGYVESTAIGFLAGLFAATNLKAPPANTALGALLNYITTGHNPSSNKESTFQPMNINFGLMPNDPTQKIKRKDKKQAKQQKCQQARILVKEWIQGINEGQ